MRHDYRKLLPVSILVGIALPPVLALAVVFVVHGGPYHVSSLLIPIEVANTLPLVALMVLARSDIDDIERRQLHPIDVTARLVGAWLAIIALATIIECGVLQAGIRRLPGSSTDAVVIFVSPILLFVIGLVAYVLLWACTATYRALRSA